VLRGTERATALPGVSFMAAAGYLTQEEALIFMLAMLWTLGVTVIAFVSLLTSASSGLPTELET